MKKFYQSSRRNFIKKFTTGTAAVAMGSNIFAAERNANYFEHLKRSSGSANDNINIAIIVAGYNAQNRQ
jgi:DNA modification methylase